MSKWIDAEWLISLYKPYENYKGREWGTSIGTILANIDDAPSIDLVRCKECKHGSDNKVYGCSLIDFNTDDYHRMYADDFCSYGERRE